MLVILMVLCILLVEIMVQQHILQVEPMVKRILLVELMVHNVLKN